MENASLHYAENTAPDSLYLLSRALGAAFAVGVAFLKEVLTQMFGSHLYHYNAIYHKKEKKSRNIFIRRFYFFNSRRNGPRKKRKKIIGVPKERSAAELSARVHTFFYYPPLYKYLFTAPHRRTALFLGYLVYCLTIRNG